MTHADVSETTQATAGGIPAALLDVGQVADLLSIGRTKVFQLDSAGRLPDSIRLGTRVRRWRRQEVEDWIAAGCPLRTEWNWKQKKGA
jgi:excisionase family DNA binding protein